MTPNQLRKKYPRFIYENFSYVIVRGKLTATFVFSIEPGIVFRPKIVIPDIPRKTLQSVPKSALDNLIFHIGLAEMPSYWKCTVSPEILIRAGKLTPAQIRFWKKLFLRGLGEFFYVNHIDPKPGFLNIISEGPRINPVPKKKKHAGILFPNGGGKDSLVGMKILQKGGKSFRPMILGEVPAAKRLSQSLRTASPIMISRQIDPKLKTLNTKGFLNGHTPFSAYLAFLGISVAELFGYSDILVANERSANEPTLMLSRPFGKSKGRDERGHPVNHQYSKSFEFEKDFRAYAQAYLTENVRYASILRPLYEIQIARLAASWPQALRAAVSCNRGQWRGVWCGTCAKCMTVFILLFPFVKTPELLAIFNKNLFENTSLWHFIPALAGDGIKPFDCVATKREMQAALFLSLQKAERERNMPALLARFKKELLPKISLDNESIDRMLAAWNTQHVVPREIAIVLKRIMKKV